MRLLLTAAAMVACAAASPAAEKSAPAERGVDILNTASFWRCHITRAGDLVRKESGELVIIDDLHGRSHKRVGPPRQQKTVLNEIPGAIRSRPPGAGWQQVEFDDSSWVRARGPFGQPLGNRAYRPIERICLRGRFRVTDPALPGRGPAKVGELTLSLAFQGGVVVYVNGVEFARSHLPKGELKPETPAEDYPREAYFAPNGDLLRNRRDLKALADRFKLRVRRLSVRIPAAMLSKGTNVLAVAVHRAPAVEAMFFGKAKSVHPRPRCWWIRLAVESVTLRSTSGEGVIPNTGRPAGLQVWNHPVVLKVFAGDYGDPCEPLRPIKICAARNGACAGQVVVGSTRPIRALGASVSDLKGKGGVVIPASAARIRYPLLDGPGCFDGLAEAPPAEVPVHADAKCAVQPVWLTVRVPADARPGEYQGTVILRAAGEESVAVPLKLKVIDWLVPDPRDFIAHVGLVQSPETVAMKYKAEMWSAKHWKLVDKSFEHLGKVGNKVLYIPLIRRTHFGNPHSMVRWIRKPDGSYTHDFSIAAKYLDTALKHLGRISVAAMYCWEPAGSQGHWGRQKATDREILFSVLDPATGALEEAKGPKWGTPGCRAFWKPVFDGIKKLLARHGIAGSMMLALAGDMRPTKAALQDLQAASGGAPWIVHTHVFVSSLQGHPVGYLASVWGIMPVFPASATGYGGRYYGWKNPFLVVTFPRGGSGIYGSGLFNHSRLNVYRGVAEGPFMARGRGRGVRGFGRSGADFWPVFKDTRSHNRGTILARYPDSRWGQLRLNYGTSYVLSPGRHGPLSTVRLEMMREGLQEAEAKVFIEKALLDAGVKAKLGDDLADRCDQMLLGRIRHWVRNLSRDTGGSDWRWYVCSGWQERSEQLYSLAAEVRARRRKPKTEE